MLWVCGYLRRLFNASRCPKLRQITLDGMGLDMSRLHHLPETCEYIHLKNVTIRLYSDGPGPLYRFFALSGSVSLSTKYHLFRCASTGRLVVRMDEFWDAIDASMKPLSEEEMSLVLLHLPSFHSGLEADITEICKK